METFSSVVRRYPDRVAIRENGREITYRELERDVLSLARCLGPECGVVGVLVTRCANTIVALLGVLMAGGTYCPIDPGYPASRQQLLAEAAGCHTAVVTAPNVVVSFEARVIKLFSEAIEADEGATADGNFPSVAHNPESPAYILFTSGSSGEPKAVAVPRGAISCSVTSMRQVFEMTPMDRTLQFVSLNWDTCLEEILPILTTGGALVFHDEASSGSFRRISRMLESEQVSVLDLPTAFWNELVYFLVEEEGSLPPCVRLVIIGGEAAHPQRLADWCGLGMDQVRLVNTYGCTETTAITHAVDLCGPACTMGDVDWRAVGSVPIGRPMPHVREFIGEDGDLIIGGPALALGYWGRPEATEERFVVLDMGDGPERVFKTGDIVSRGPDGNLSYKGRLDRQIKIRGIRVHPAEIEAEIERHPKVAVAAATPVQVAGRTVVVAYVVPRSSDESEHEALKADLWAYLKARVPDHLVPSRISIVSELVYTATGKVDRAGSHRAHASTLDPKEAQT